MARDTLFYIAACTVPGPILARWAVETRFGRRYNMAIGTALSGDFLYVSALVSTNQAVVARKFSTPIHRSHADTDSELRCYDYYQLLLRNPGRYIHLRPFQSFVTYRVSKLMSLSVCIHTETLHFDDPSDSQRLSQYDWLHMCYGCAYYLKSSWGCNKYACLC